jgi:hypothetical protein
MLMIGGTVAVIAVIAALAGYRALKRDPDTAATH